MMVHAEDPLLVGILQHHAEFQRHSQGLLQEARAAGDLLWQKVQELGGREAKSWSSWRHANLIQPKHMSKDTCNVYLRVAEHWDQPAFRAARAAGEIDSIALFIKWVRGHKPLMHAAEQEQNQARRKTVQQILNQFQSHVLDLCDANDQATLDILTDPEFVEPFFVELIAQAKQRAAEQFLLRD